MKPEVVKEYRAKARAERSYAAALSDPKAAKAAFELADSYERVAEAFESLMRRRQDNCWPGGIGQTPVHGTCDGGLGQQRQA